MIYFSLQGIKKSLKCIGLTKVVYKQPYELYLKTIEYQNFLKKSTEKKEDINESREQINTNKPPMECPDKLYIKPQVC